MKRFNILLLAILALGTYENKSHAFAVCATTSVPSYGETREEHCWHSYGATFWLTSTTFTGPLALFFDGQIDLKNPEVRELVLMQAEQILNGQGAAINDSENLVRVLAELSGVDDAQMAEVLKSLEASGSEISNETIQKFVNSSLKVHP